MKSLLAPLSAVLGLALASAPADATPRRILLEFFSTERCTNCPLAHSNLERIFGNNPEDIIMISHHAGFYDDAFTIPESVEYEWFYNPLRGTYAPAAMMDRSCFEDELPEVYGEQVPVFDGSKASMLTPAYTQAASVPAQADLQIATTYDAKSRLLSVTVSGSTDASDASDLRLNVFLTEDSLFTLTQAGAYGSFYHRHSARQCLTGTWGESIYAGATFERTYSTTLPQEWNARKIDVVAFASHYDATDRRRCQVLNAASAPIIASNADNRFYLDAGSIVTPAEVCIDQLDQVVIDYTQCPGTDEGLNPASGKGTGWLLCPDGSTRDVTYSDDYRSHRLTIKVTGDPAVKAGEYRLHVPQGVFNVYGNAQMVNEEATFYYYVTGKNDRGDDGELHLLNSYPEPFQSVELPLSAITLTFDRDITVRHSIFDAAGRITNLSEGGYIQLAMNTEGPVLTITRGTYSSSDFIEGQRYQLEIFEGRIKSADDETVVFPAFTLDFSIVKTSDDNSLHVVAQIPATGESIRNAGSVTFNRNITKVDPEKVTLVNENGHHALLSSVGRDSQASRAMIFNIDSSTKLEANTTYHLMLEAGAVSSGNLTCEALDAAYWCIPIEHFSFDCPLQNHAVPSLQSLVLTTEAEGISRNPEVEGICITGVSTNQDHVYAQLADYQIDGQDLTLHFDRLLTPEVLAEGQAIYNSVKVIIPEGAFIDDSGCINRQTEMIIYIIEAEEIGEQTWTFNPASGSNVERLGYAFTTVDANDNPIVSYSISFEVTGQNVYVRIPDGTLLYIIEQTSGQIVRTFERYGVSGVSNRFTLDLGTEPITADGYYQLVMPAEAIYIYGDANYLTEPIHPDADVTALWIVGNPEGIEAVHPDADDATSAIDLMGRKVAGAHGLRIKHNSIIFNF